MSSMLHFIGGGELEVDESVGTAGQLLWSYDVRSAQLNVKGTPVTVNPAAVAYVIDVDKAD